MKHETSITFLLHCEAESKLKIQNLSHHRNCREVETTPLLHVLLPIASCTPQILVIFVLGSSLPARCDNFHLLVGLL